MEEWTTGRPGGDGVAKRAEVCWDVGLHVGCIWVHHVHSHVLPCTHARHTIHATLYTICRAPFTPTSQQLTTTHDTSRQQVRWWVEGGQDGRRGRVAVVQRNMPRWRGQLGFRHHPATPAGPQTPQRPSKHLTIPPPHQPNPSPPPISLVGQ